MANNLAFITVLGEDISEILKKLTDFTSNVKVSPKSLGISRVNDGYLSVLTYDATSHTPIKFDVVVLDSSKATTSDSFTAALTESEANLENIICHAITGVGSDIYIVVMEEAKA